MTSLSLSLREARWIAAVLPADHACGDQIVAAADMGWKRRWVAYLAPNAVPARSCPLEHMGGRNMCKFFSVVISILMTVAAGLAQTGNPISLASDGWTVTADGERGVFSITQDTLGTVIKDARFNLKGEHGLRPLKNWSVFQEAQPRLQEQARHQLSIRTLQPQTGWLIELAPNSVKISSTEAAGVLTAKAPASTDRVIARVLDPQGVPVTWVGTDAGSVWGASETRNPSFLPSHNPAA